MSEQLNTALQSARAELEELCEAIDPRVLVFSVVRMMDWLYAVPPSATSVLQRPHGLLGAPFLLRMLPLKALDAPGWPLLVSHQTLEIATGELLRRAATIAACERSVAHARTGLATIREDADGVFIRYPALAYGLEKHDLRDLDLLLTQVALHDDGDAREAAELVALRPRVSPIASRLVARWNDHFIQYDADPFLDDYFLRAALLRCRYDMRNQDTFDGEVNFGGIPFNTYRAVIAALVSFSLKHIAFAEILLEKDSDLRPPNVLTIVDDIPKLTSSLHAILHGEADEPLIRQVLEAVTFQGEQDQDLLVPGECLAPLMTIGQDFVLRSLQGTLDTPFYFLLKKLRKRHRSDWDVAVNSREQAFRSDIEQVFHRAFFRLGRAPAILRHDGATLTDIDAAIFDPRAKVLALFQLKWQDPFGHVAAERRSRATNFVKTGNDWVERIHRWLSTHSIEELQRVLRLPVEPVHAVRLIVLARTNANFSGALQYDSRAAWGNWAQLGRLVMEKRPTSDVLTMIHSELISEFDRRRRSVTQVASEELSLGKLRVHLAIVQDDE